MTTKQFNNAVVKTLSESLSHNLQDIRVRNNVETIMHYNTCADDKSHMAIIKAVDINDNYKDVYFVAYEYPIMSTIDIRKCKNLKDAQKIMREMIAI